MVKLKYEDFPKLGQEFKNRIFKNGQGPDFKAWLRIEHNASVAIHYFDDEMKPRAEWFLEFEDPEDAIVFRLKWS